MKIENIKQLKTNLYQISVEKNNSFLLLDETILKYTLVKGKYISNLELKEIKKYDELMQTYYKCVKILKSKIKTTSEMIVYLKKDNIDDKDIEYIINKLKCIKLLNDESYLNSYINHRINASYYGPERIKKELLEKGLGEAKISLELAKIDNNIWLEKIEKIISKKLKSNHKYSSSDMKQKLIMYLINMGYSKKDLDCVKIEINSDNDNLFLEKEYLKLEKKYMNKSISKEEKYKKIISSLIRKKFTYEDIKKIIKKNED